MRIGTLRGLALRPLFDVDSLAGSSPVPAAVTPIALVPTEATPDAAAEPRLDAVPVADEVPSEDDGDAEPDLTAAEWQSEAAKARKQAARYRTELRTAQARIAELETAQAAPVAPDVAGEANARAVAAERRAAVAEAAAEQQVPTGLLSASRDLAQAETPDQISAALGKIKAFLAPTSAGVHRPPVDVSTAPTLDQQIADAEKRGDVQASIRLKSAKFSR